MLKLVLQRILLGVVTLVVISVLVFAATEILPGDVATAILGNESTEEARAALRDRLGLERPIAERYGAWLEGAVRGDFGTSISNDVPVADVVGLRLRNTLVLAGITALVAVPLSLGLGLLCAAFPGGWFDRSLAVGSLFVISLPEFVVGLLLMLLFAVHLRWLPTMTPSIDWSSPASAFRALALPALTLLAAVQAHIIRMTRAAVLEVMRKPYIEMALLKGVPRSRIILRHALPNALAPIVNVVALNVGYLISGVVVVETVFTYPGLGRLIVDAVASRDMPVLQATAMIFCSSYVVLTLIADLVALVANPRARTAS